MSFRERAKHYVVRQKGRTILLLIIFTVALLIGLLGLTALRSFEDSLLLMGERSNAKITVFSTDSEQPILTETINGLSDVDNVNRVNKVNQAVASLNGLQIGTGSGEALTEAKVRLQGFDDLSSDSLFGQEVAMLEYGRLELQENDVIIHQLLADMNGLKLGDILSFSNSQGEVQGVIRGVYFYSEASVENEEHTPSTFRFENLIFAHPALINHLQGVENYIEAHFYVSDPSIIQDTRNIFEYHLLSTAFEVWVSDELYRRIASPLTQAAGLITMILAITGIGVITVISLLLIIWSRERKKETALLLSIGEEKKKIIMQRLMEIMMIYLPSLLFASSIAFAINPYVKGFLERTAQFEDSTDLSLILSSGDVISVFIIGIITLLSVVTLSCFSIMRQSPKSILARGD